MQTFQRFRRTAAESVATYARALRTFSPGARLYLWHTAVSGISFSMYALLLNLYLYSLGYRQDFMGLINALPAVVVLALGLPAGSFADRRGYRTLLIAGVAILAASGFGLALSRSAAAP